MKLENKLRFVRIQCIFEDQPVRVGDTVDVHKQLLGRKIPLHSQM